MSEETRWEETRASWLTNQQGSIGMQRRRGEELYKRARAFQRDEAGVRPTTHTEAVTPRIFSRKGFWGWFLFLLFPLGLLFPVGWPLGRVLASVLEANTPKHFSRYPWRQCLLLGLAVSAVLFAAPLPSDPLVRVAAAYLLAQIPGAIMFAGAHGVLNGWHAVPEEPHVAIKKKKRP